MTLSPESVLNKAGPFPERMALCSVNWLGDAIMSMPAIQLLHQAATGSDLIFLMKPGLKSLWEMHDAPAKILVQQSGWNGTWHTANALRDLQPQRAYILPHSIRSALFPALARIPERIGLPGDAFRNRFLTTAVVTPQLTETRQHQSFEYADLFFPGMKLTALPLPSLKVPQAAMNSVIEKLNGYPKPWISILPGAARGPAKQWAAARYAETAKRLAATTGGTIVALGTAAEKPVCDTVVGGIPDGQSISLAGKTSLQELAAVLALSAVTACNDSGGMHLAGAVDCPVVAIFGITNPAQTGPLGRRIRILQNSTRKTRDIPRHSEEAKKSLDSITVEQVYEACKQMIDSN